MLKTNVLLIRIQWQHKSSICALSLLKVNSLACKQHNKLTIVKRRNAFSYGV